MKKLIFLIAICTITSCTGQSNQNKSTRSDKICMCYNVFVEKVKAKNISLEGNNENGLLKVYKELVSNNPEFKICVDDTLLNGDLFSKSKLRMWASMKPNCVDYITLSKVADSGPYIYKTY